MAEYASELLTAAATATVSVIGAVAAYRWRAAHTDAKRANTLQERDDAVHARTLALIDRMQADLDRMQSDLEAARAEVIAARAAKADLSRENAILRERLRQAQSA